MIENKRVGDVNLLDQIEIVLKSAAHASECAAAAFYLSQADGTASLEAACGTRFSKLLALEDVVTLKTAGKNGVVIIDDLLQQNPTERPQSSAGRSGPPIRFMAASVVRDAQGSAIGFLMLVDPQPKSGLSAAKIYVLEALAAKLGRTLTLQDRVIAPSEGGAPTDERLRLLESVVVNAKDSILITEAEPFNLPGPRIVYCNPAFTRTTGYDEEEVIGKTPRILQGPATDPRSRAAIRASLEQWRPIEIEVLNYKKDGEPFWVELSIVPVADDKGWFTHWVSVQRDATERKNAEEIRTRVRVAEAGNANLQLLMNDLQRALDAAEAANVAKSEFLANMSHEIRTPLNGVLGMTQALWMDELTPAQRERVAIIRDSGQSLLAVLNDVLDLAKIESGHFELDVSEFELEEVARGVCAAYTEGANRKGVSFGLTLSDDVCGRWLGDSVRLRQILYNLVSNALKFTAQGEVTVDLNRSGSGDLKITVRDTGIGIAAEKLPHLFSKFYQTDSSNTRRFGGTGLGLAICRQLCDLMGGSIHADSLEGRGSTFHVVLPMQQLSQGSLAREPEGVSYELHDDRSVGPNVSGLQILAAEDNASNQLVLRALLQAFEITPLIVSNGAQALEACRRQRFDAVLMDVQMPEMDGVEATRLIREMEAQKGLDRTPIIALSANAMTHQVREYIAAGMDAHIAKPINIENLAAALARLSEPSSSDRSDVEAFEMERAS